MSRDRLPGLQERVDAAHPEQSARELAVLWLREQDPSPEQLWAYAVAWITSEVEARQRWLQSEVERRATWARRAGKESLDQAPEPIRQAALRQETEEAEKASYKAELRARYAEIDAECQRELMESIRTATENFRAAVRLELTEELLASSFALGDGTRVTWAEATVEQHQARVAMLQGMAAGTLETAARHEEAVAMLREAGAPCLGTLRETEDEQEAAA